MKIRSFFLRLTSFLAGLTGMAPSALDTDAFNAVNRAKPRPTARMIDLGPKRDKNRYRPFRLEYSTDLPQFPVTRQVARAELRQAAFKAHTIWIRSEGPRVMVARRLRDSRRFWSTGRITAREMSKRLRWTKVLDGRGMVSDACRSWAAGWIARSGRV